MTLEHLLTWESMKEGWQHHSFSCWTDRKLESLGKRGHQLKNYLYHVGLWPCLWGIFLIASWCRRVQTTAGDAIHTYEAGRESHGEWARWQHSSTISTFLSGGLSVISWSKPFLPRLLLAMVFYHIFTKCTTTNTFLKRCPEVCSQNRCLVRTLICDPLCVLRFRSRLWAEAPQQRVTSLSHLLQMLSVCHLPVWHGSGKPSPAISSPNHSLLYPVRVGSIFCWL